MKKLKIAIKHNEPSNSLFRWGDFWYAHGLAKAFGRLDCKCVVHYKDQWASDPDVDMVIYLRGLDVYRPQQGPINVMWLISHPESCTIEELNQFDVVFCASSLYFSYIADKLKCPCYYLPQATDADIFKPITSVSRQDIDLLFVGSNYYRDKMRQIVADVLAIGKPYDLWVIGPRWSNFLDPRYWKAEYIEPHQLINYYARAKIVLNDHHDTMKQWGFINDRTFALASIKAFQISNYVAGLDELGVITYRTPYELKELIDYYLVHDRERQWRAEMTYQRCRMYNFDKVVEPILSATEPLLNRRPNTQKLILVQDRNDNTLPKISIIMACHNAEQYLAESLDSILNQTFADWELLAVDDASSDRTRQILQAYADKDRRIRIWFFDDNKGPYVRRNFAIGQSRAPFICIHDADDLMRRDKLAVFYEAISKDDRLGIVGSYHRRFLETIPADEEFGDCLTKNLRHEDLMAAFPQTWYLCSHGSAIIRKSLFETLGLYDRQPWGSDAFWLAKAGLYAYLTGNVRIENLPQTLTYVRAHSSSQTGTIVYEDPRSRRHRHKAYFRQKLTEIAEHYKANPSLDLAARLRDCTVDDFIPRFGHLFTQWESEPPTDAMLQSLLAQIRADMQNQWFVSAAIKLNVLETMDSRIAEHCPDFYWMRALAYYAAGHDDKSRQDIDRLPATQRNRFAVDFSITAAAERKRRIAAFYDGQISPRHAAQSASLPVVSVIMPAYNAAAYIRQAIDSVLAQTDGRFELLVINDGSTDATESIIKSYTDPRIQLLTQANAGPSAARNAGLRSARGDFIVFLDSDDQMTPDFIAQHLSAFEQMPQADLIYCDDALIDEHGRPLRTIVRADYPDRRRLIADLFRNGYPVIPFRTCVRRSVFDKIGLYDERLGVSEDYDMLRRFIRHGLIAAHLNGAFYIRRMTADSQSRTFTRDKARMHFEAVRTFGQTFRPAELFADIDWSKIPTDRHAFTACLYTAKNFIAIGQDYQRSSAAEIMAETAFAFAAEPLEQCLALCPNDPDINRLLTLCRRYEQRPAEAAV